MRLRTGMLLGLLVFLTSMTSAAQVDPLSQRTSCNDPDWNARYGIYLEYYRPSIQLNTELLYGEINEVNKEAEARERLIQLYDAFSLVAGYSDIETARDATASAVKTAGTAVSYLGEDVASIVADQILDWIALGLKPDLTTYAKYVVDNTIKTGVRLYGTVEINTLLREYRMLSAADAVLHTYYRYCGDQEAIRRNLDIPGSYDDHEGSLSFLPWVVAQYDSKRDYGREAQSDLSEMLLTVLRGVNETRDLLRKEDASSSLPDLEPRSLRVRPRTARPGGAVTAQFRAYNKGQGAAGASHARLRLSSSEGEVGTSDPELATVDVPAIERRESFSFEDQVRLPEELEPGTYYVWVILDAQSEAGQTPRGENNDKAYQGIEVEDFSPDLHPRYISVSPSVAAPSQDVEIEVRVRNQGQAEAKPSTMRLRLASSEADVTTDDPELSTAEIPALPEGEEVIIEERVELPRDLPAGRHYVWAILDVNSQAGQTPAEEENDKAYDDLRVELRTPDLRSARMSATPRRGISPGETVKVEFEVRNRGQGKARASRARLRLSSSREQVTTQDRVLATVEVPALAGGERARVEKDVQLPAEVAPGTHYLWLIVDVDSRAGQTFEDEKDDRRYYRIGVEE